MRTLQLAALAASAALLAGCASSRTSNGEAGKAVPRILADVEAAAGQARSLHLVGDAGVGSGLVTLDLELVAGKGGEGTISENGLSFSEVRVGAKAYFKGGASFWRQLAGPALAPRLGASWVEAPAASPRFAALGAFTSLRGLLARILGAHGVLVKGGFTTIAGQRVFSLRDTTRGGMLFIAADGAPLPVEATAPSGGGGPLEFEGWNRSYALAAPARSIAYATLTG